MGFSNKFIDKYGDKYILEKCKEHNCLFKDIKKEYYLIIDGDRFKGNTKEKSVDCIIIDLRRNVNGEYTVILCELTSGSKLISDSFEKFKSSGKLIVDTMNNFNESISRIYCIMLGKVKQSGRNVNKKALMKRFNIQGYDKSVIIQNEKCGFSITQLELI